MSVGVGRYVVMITLVAVMMPPALARADGVSITSRSLDPHGWPRLIANYVPNGSLAIPSWRVCSPDCGAIVATGSVYDAGPTAPGTTFEASTTFDGTTTTDRSAAWGGQASSTAPPAFDGSPVVGATLTPHPGTWIGGWGDEHSRIGMRACRTAAADDCRAMTASILQSGNPSEIRIDRAYDGWYVGAIEARIGVGEVAAAIGYAAPLPGHLSPLQPPVPGQTVAVGPLVGPVRSAASPRVVIRKRASHQHHALVLATIACGDECVARVTLGHGHLTVRRRMVVSHRRARVQLRPGTFPRAATTVRVDIRFEHDPTRSSGTVVLR